MMPERQTKRLTASTGASKRFGADDVVDAIEDLHSLDAASLAKRWRALVGGAVPTNLGRPLTLRVLAYKLQAQRFGDLDKASVRELLVAFRRSEAPIDRASVMAADDQIGASLPIKSVVQPLRHARPGSLLTREHGGTMHRVMVTDEGVVWNGRTYDSLSKVAFAITGTRWNGPRFFGLRDKITNFESESQRKASSDEPREIIGRGRAALLGRATRRDSP